MAVGPCAQVSLLGPQPWPVTTATYAPLDPPDVRFERGVSRGYAEATDPGTGRPLYLALDAVMPNADVDATAVHEETDEYGTSRSAHVRLTTAGGDKTNRATRECLGGRLDGRVHTAPVVKAVITDRLEVSGDDRFDVDRLAKGMAGRR